MAPRRKRSESKVRQAETLPAPAISPREHLESLLAAEAVAAKNADLEVLLGLQEEKRRVVEAIYADPPSAAECAQLVERAGANLPLLRQLVALHRGLLGAEAPLYGPRGLKSADTTRAAGRL